MTDRHRTKSLRRGTGSAGRAPPRRGPGVDDHRARAAAPAQSAGRARSWRRSYGPGAPSPPPSPYWTDGPMSAWTRSSWSGSPSERRRYASSGTATCAPALAAGASGATTVSATAFLAARAGIRVFATGGLGGVHREWTETQDESADLRLLAQTRITVVCAGVKSILDVPATLQRLETLGVGGGSGTAPSASPASTCPSSGEPVDWTVRTPEEVAEVMRAQGRAGRAGVGADRRQSGAGGGAAGSRRCTTGCSRDALDECGERGISGPGRHAVPARLSDAAHGRGLAGGQPGGGARQRAAGGADRGGAAEPRRTGRAGPLLVVGDVVTDVVARHRGGRSRPARTRRPRIRTCRAAPGPMWPAGRRIGAARTYGCSARVGADDAAWHEARLRAAGRTSAARRRRRGADRHGRSRWSTRRAERTFLTDSGAVLRLVPARLVAARCSTVSRICICPATSSSPAEPRALAGAASGAGAERPGERGPGVGGLPRRAGRGPFPGGRRGRGRPAAERRRGPRCSPGCPIRRTRRPS